ncbi:MAG: PTS sugar transporter subunit IIA [Alkalibacterium sp.]|uniref:PTS system, N-acetylgalactosamine-specific IIA component n=1 Tax=Alkalibacterium gilvum TaxID=1130080 RepID=A0A1H6UAG8_9LACT|nr:MULTISPECIES: PTS galactosamine/N-acetylgalactosamine transporter subunit IIA [Alkalibacterium]MDN6296100.1 PTS sugar transporter subunit IIA [Alkalibacterium sp.]SEI89321.1 PTS system, N-acetylgalactosamine-specific IIA component [Alkalibacterium gilvum]
MIGVIIVGHGEFAHGLHSVIELVAGKQERLELVKFLQSDSSETLKNNLKVAIEKLNTKETIIFTDIPGGTPYKESVLLSSELENIEVISGTNVPMLLEILFDRAEGAIADVKERAIDTGKKQILSFEVESSEQTNDYEEGI